MIAMVLIDYNVILSSSDGCGDREVSGCQRGNVYESSNYETERERGQAQFNGRVFCLEIAIHGLLGI